jgi:hypothetical protein
MATVAMFVALGGSSYAALSVSSNDVRDNSLRSRDIRDNSLTSRDVRNGSLTAADFKSAGTTDFRVINRSSNTLQLDIVLGTFADAPPRGSVLNPNTEQDFSVSSRGAGNVFYWVLNAAQQQIGQVTLGMVNADEPVMHCAASGATLPDGSSTWDGACSVDGMTATITG